MSNKLHKILLRTDDLIAYGTVFMLAKDITSNLVIKVRKSKII